MGWKRVVGREAQEGENICRHIVDSHCSTAETNNNIVKQLHSIKNNLKNRITLARSWAFLLNVAVRYSLL